MFKNLKAVLGSPVGYVRFLRRKANERPSFRCCYVCGSYEVVTYSDERPACGYHSELTYRIS